MIIGLYMWEHTRGGRVIYGRRLTYVISRTFRTRNIEKLNRIALTEKVQEVQSGGWLGGCTMNFGHSALLRILARFYGKWNRQTTHLE